MSELESPMVAIARALFVTTQRLDAEQRRADHAEDAQREAEERVEAALGLPRTIHASRVDRRVVEAAAWSERVRRESADKLTSLAARFSGWAAHEKICSEIAGIARELLGEKKEDARVEGR